MVSIVATGALALLGYSISQIEKKNKTMQTISKDTNSIVTKNDTPSGDNVYHNRYSDQVFNEELQRATDAYQRAYEGGYLYKDYPESRWQKRYYERADKVTQLETDIINPEPATTTKYTANSLSAFQNSNNIQSFDLQRLANTNSEMPVNLKRNRIPDPEFVPINNENNEPNPPFITQTNIPNQQINTHNNMEPFFGSSIKQNTAPTANRTTLEQFTGTQPVYAHKKETKRFFPLIKNAFAVEQQNIENRDLTRYIPSSTYQNILPFEQIKVGPGLNQPPERLTTNIGFQETWRPENNGVFKDVNELRVNPKLVYEGRVVGGAPIISWGGEQTAPVISRRPYKDLSFTTIPENTALRQNLPYRDNLPVSPEVDKEIILDKDTIVLKPVTRLDCSTFDATVGIADHKSKQKHQVYYLDTARKTVRQETENNVHDKINANDADRRGQTYFFDTAKETIREETEDNEHSRINANDADRRGQTYYFDTAKETIREQTEDNEHRRINANDQDRKGQTYFFDTAKETIREQTEDHEHNKINPSGTTGKFSLHDIFAFLNASINGLKEWGIAKNRPPTTVGAKYIPDKKVIGDYEIFRRQQFDTYEHSKGYDTTAPVNVNKLMIGNETRGKPIYPKDCIINNQRIDPVFTEQFRNNPYTQSLQSWHIPYNPKYPVIQGEIKPLQQIA